MHRPALRLIPNNELNDMRAQQQKSYQPNGEGQGKRYTSQLAAHVDRCYDDARWAKTEIEDRIFEALRRRKGEYPDQKLQKLSQLGSVKTYLQHTALKIRAAKSWAKDIILPAGERPWSVNPTEIPELPESIDQQILQKMSNSLTQVAEEYGDLPNIHDITDEIDREKAEILEIQRQEANKRANAMSELIADQFQEGEYAKAMDEFLDDVMTFPSAILKGPVVCKTKSGKWVGDRFAVEDAIITKTRRVHPFDFYPSPQMDDVNNGYIIERMKLTRKEIQRYLGTPGVNDLVLKLALEENRLNSHVNRETIDAERRRLENKEQNVQTAGSADDRIEVIEYWGSINGKMLKEWGLVNKGLEDHLEYEVCCLKIDRHVFKAILNPNPLGLRPYYVTSYEKTPGSIWGKGIPEIMKDIQDAMNMVIRAMLDNIAIASGPQVGLDPNSVHPSQRASATKIYPRKVWLLKRGYGNNSSLPISFDQPKLVVNQMMAMLEKLEQLSDDYTGIPAYTYGNEQIGGAGETATGLGMLMKAASKGIRQVIAYIGEDVVSKRVGAQYYHNLLYHDDPSIKGDCKVDARGTLAEIMKDALRRERVQFLQTINPARIEQIIDDSGVAKLVRAVTDDLEIPNLVMSDNKIAEMKENQQAMSLQEPGLEPESEVPSDAKEA